MKVQRLLLKSSNFRMRNPGYRRNDQAAVDPAYCSMVLVTTTFAPTTTKIMSTTREQTLSSAPNEEAKISFSISVILVGIGASITVVSLVFIIFTFRDRFD